MEFLNDIQKETLIICNDLVKEKILAMHLLKPLKFMNIKQFRDNYYFRYDEKAILFLIEKYHLKYEIAKEYLENIYYVENKTYNNSKLDFLVTIYNELKEENLLIFNNQFKNYLKRTNIIIYDIEIDKFLKGMLKDLNYQIIERKFNNYNHTVYEFDSIISEVKYVATKIAELINNGVDIKKIKLLNIEENYYSTISWIFSLHNLKVNIPSKSKLTCYNLTNKFLNELDDLNSVGELLETLDDGSNIYQELLNTVNKYYQYNNLNLLKYKIENSYLTSNKYDNAIDIVPYLEYISSSDEYYFMLNFNDSVIPKTSLDTDYITDNIKDKTLMTSTRTKNKLINERTIKCLNDIKNLTITYKLNDYNASYYPSPLCKLYEVKKDNIDITESYSSTFDKISLINGYDNYFKYGELTKELPILKHNYHIKYNSYSNKYTKINRHLNSLTLSYSKMNIYNKCAFRYYLSDILKIDKYEESFSALIGNTVHYVMEKCLSNNDFDYQKYINEYLSNRVLSNKESFFLKKYTTILGDLITEILKEREAGRLDKEMYEKSITIPYDDNIVFNGKIDKILYNTDDNNTYVAVIDYKTGADLINLNYLNYGIDIQLPIYMFLVKHMDFKNIKYVGFYLQKLNISDNDYRLEGYSNSNPEIISYLDKDYTSSKIIKGLKVKNDGSFYSTSKILSDSEIDKIIDVVNNNIIKVIENIKTNIFTINPKVDNDKHIGCAFCKYSDICFHTEDDDVLIRNEALGGDN